MAHDRDAATRAIDAFLRALGRDPDTTPHLRGTPRRVADAWLDDLLSGEAIDVGALLRAESSPYAARSSPQLVALHDLDVAMMCPHHLMPALGRATVAYVPGARLAGIGAIARALDAFARRLTLQEDVGENLVGALLSDLGAHGAFCRIRARHSCLSARGERSRAWVDSIAVAGTLGTEGTHHTLLALLHDRASIEP